MKKIVSLIVILTFLMTTLTALVLPASAETYSGDCGADGSNLRWSLDTGTGTLTISGSGEMRDYSYVDAPWYSYGNEIEKINLSAELTGIGSYAFYGCSGVKEITIPSSVVYIGASAFGDCTALEKVTFENTEGWGIQESYSSGDYQSFSKEDLGNSANAAFYLRDAYSGYEWLIPDDYEKPGVRISTFAAILLIILLLALSLLPFAAMIALIVLAVRAVSKPRKDLKKQKELDAKRKKQMMLAGGVGLAGLAVGLIALLTKKRK